MTSLFATLKHSSKEHAIILPSDKRWRFTKLFTEGRNNNINSKFYRKTKQIKNVIIW